MKAVEFKRFDGVGAEVDFQTLRNRFWDAARIELFRREQIIKLNIRFDEIYHKCNSDEWEEFVALITNNRVKLEINKWWQFWDR